jgi:hypothetical protein
LEKLIQEFDMQKDFARHGVIRPPDLTDVDQRVHSGEEGTVEPSPTLRDKFWNGVCPFSSAVEVGF